MGQYSYLKANKSNQKNITSGDRIKFLIPEKNGGGSISGYYDGYGRINNEDKSYCIEGLVVLINTTNNNLLLIDDLEELSKDLKEKGINMTCSDKVLKDNKFPLKLVDYEVLTTYEECEEISLVDHAQGLRKVC